MKLDRKHLGNAIVGDLELARLSMPSPTFVTTRKRAFVLPFQNQPSQSSSRRWIFYCDVLMYSHAGVDTASSLRRSHGSFPSSSSIFALQFPSATALLIL